MIGLGPRHVTAEQFAVYLESYPPTLRCWQRPGLGGVPAALAVLDYHAARAEAGTPLQVSDTQNGLAVATDWTRRHMHRSPGKKVGGLGTGVLWRTAIAYWRLRNHLTEVESGRRGFETKGRWLRLPDNGDLQLRGLTMWLDLAEAYSSFTTPLPANSSDHRIIADGWYLVERWHQMTGGQVPWFYAPEQVRDPVRDAATIFMSEAASYLPAHAVTVGGYSIAMFYAYWRELLSLAIYNHSALTQVYPQRATFTPEFRRDVFVEQIATSAGIPLNAADAITTLLTLGPAPVRDVALTPIVSLDNGALFVMSALVETSNPERNMLKVLQSDPRRYGTMGNLLGDEGEQTVLRLLRERLSPGTLCAATVEATRRKGQTASDLDVVAYSPEENLLVVLEVKWHIGVDGTYEEIAIEQAALDKRNRLKSLRYAIEAGAVTVYWPDTWPPVPDDTEWRWFVLTHDVLPTQDNNNSDIRIRSYQMLKHLLPTQATLRQLVNLLDAPPTPDCAPNWERHRFGRLVVDVEGVGLFKKQPPPFNLPKLEHLPTTRRSTIRKWRK